MFTISYADNVCKLGDDPRHYWVMEAARSRGCTNKELPPYTYLAFDGQGIATLYMNPLSLYNGAVKWLVTHYPQEYMVEQQGGQEW